MTASAAVDLTAQACAAFLACAAHNGVNPAYIHRVEATPTEAHVTYDGTLTDQVIDSLKFCVPEKPVVCEYHPKDEPWTSPK